MKKIDELFSKLWDKISIKKTRNFGIIFLLLSLVFLRMYDIRHVIYNIVMFVIMLDAAVISFGISMAKKDDEEFRARHLEYEKKLNKILKGKRRIEVEFLHNLSEDNDYLIGKVIWQNMLNFIKNELELESKLFAVYDINDKDCKLNIELVLQGKEGYTIYHNIPVDIFLSNFKVVE